MCSMHTHTLSYTFIGKKVTPSSVSDSADVPVALRSSRGEFVKCALCILTHYPTHSQARKSRTVLMSQLFFIRQEVS